MRAISFRNSHCSRLFRENDGNFFRNSSWIISHVNVTFKRNPCSICFISFVFIWRKMSVCDSWLTLKWSNWTHTSQIRSWMKIDQFEVEVEKNWLKEIWMEIAGHASLDSKLLNGGIYSRYNDWWYCWHLPENLDWYLNEMGATEPKKRFYYKKTGSSAREAEMNGIYWRLRLGIEICFSWNWDLFLSKTLENWHSTAATDLKLPAIAEPVLVARKCWRSLVRDHV